MQLKSEIRMFVPMKEFKKDKAMALGHLPKKNPTSHLLKKPKKNQPFAASD